MPRKRHNELVAGIFVLVTLGVLLGVVLWLGASEVLHPPLQRAVFFAAERDGSLDLAEGALVQLNDDPVGKISRIRYDPGAGGTYYTAAITRAGAAIHSDAEALVVTGFIGGSRLVILKRGTASAPLADRASPVTIHPGGLEAAMRDIASASQKIRKQLAAELDARRAGSVLAKVHEVLDRLADAGTKLADVLAAVRAEADAAKPDTILAHVRRAAGNVASASHDLSRQVDAGEPGSLMAKAHGIAGDVKETSSSVRWMATAAEPAIDRMLTSAAGAAEAVEGYTKKEIAEVLLKVRESNNHLLSAMKNIEAVTSQAKETVVLNRANIDEILDNARRASADLKAGMKDIRRRPWRLIQRPEKEDAATFEILNLARDFVTGAEQLKQAVGKLEAVAKLHPEGIPAADASLKQIQGDLRRAFTDFSAVEQALWKRLGQEQR